MPVYAPPLLSQSAYQSGMPATSLSALALANAATFGLDVRALRVSVSHLAPADWTTDDIGPAATETRHILYAPSPRAQRLFVCVWYGLGRQAATLSSGDRAELDVWIAKLASPNAPEPDTLRAWRLQPALEAANQAIYLTALLVTSSGINAGEEIRLATAWTAQPAGAIPVAALAGETGWLGFSYRRLRPLAVALVEVVL